MNMFQIRKRREPQTTLEVCEKQVKELKAMLDALLQDVKEKRYTSVPLSPQSVIAQINALTRNGVKAYAVGHYPEKVENDLSPGDSNPRERKQRVAFQPVLDAIQEENRVNAQADPADNSSDGDGPGLAHLAFNFDDDDSDFAEAPMWSKFHK